MASNIINDRYMGVKQILLPHVKCEPATTSLVSLPGGVVAGDDGVVQVINGELIVSNTIDLGASE